MIARGKDGDGSLRALMAYKQMNHASFFPSQHVNVRVAIVTALFGTATASSCSHDWTSYDPRVTDEGSSSSTSSTNASSSSNSGGMGGSSSSSSSGEGGSAGMGGMGGMGGAGGGMICVPDTGKACYSGPQGTENVGMCKGGATLCQPDGMSYGPCLGEVLPIVEACNTGSIDDDCNGQVNDHCGIWARRFGTALEQRIADIATDVAGNVYVTGVIYGSADFGGGVLTSAGGSDIFVAKFDKDGSHVWSVSLGGTLDDVASAIALDSAGGVYVTGSFMDTLTINGIVETAIDLRDALVIGIAPDGIPLGFVTMGGMGDQVGNDIAVDSDGNIIVTGGFTTEVITGLGTLTATNLLDGFLMKFDAFGTGLWQKSFGGSGNDEGISLKTNSANDVLVTGYFDETVDFGGGEIIDGGSSDVFLAKLDAMGNHVFSKAFPAVGDQFVDSIALDAAGNIFLFGEFDMGANFGGGVIAAAGGEDLFLTKLDSTGKHVFTKTYGDSGNQYARAMAVDALGNPVFVVAHEGVVDYGGGPISNSGSAGSSDVVVVKLQNSGAFSWSRRFGSSTDQDVRAVTTDAMNNIYVGGEFSGAITIGPSSITAVSGDDAFLFKLPP